MKTPLAPLCLASAVSLAILATPASAALIPSGGGDYSHVPLYRALAFGTVSFGGDAINGIDYASNNVPLAVARGNGTIVHNGATLVHTGASAFAGFYAGRNYAEIQVTNANASDTYYEVAGQGSATSVQFFTPEAAAAYATFTWHVGGSEYNPLGIGDTSCPSGSPSCFRAATGRLDFGASTQPSSAVNWNALFEEDLSQDPAGGSLASIRAYGPGTYVYNLPIQNIGAVINLFYWSSAFAQINPGQIGAGSNVTLRADYYNTYALESVGLFDAGGNPISEWMLRDLNLDQNVFDQTGRLAPLIDPPSITVPEPATLGLLALAFAALAGRPRRKL